jgi:CRP-like cAMP-binding protein
MAISMKQLKAVENRTRYFFKKKGEHFLREGQHLSSYFVLRTGLIRAYFFKNGREMNSWFGETKIFWINFARLY